MVNLKKFWLETSHYFLNKTMFSLNIKMSIKFKLIFCYEEDRKEAESGSLSERITSLLWVENIFLRWRNIQNPWQSKFGSVEDEDWRVLYRDNSWCLMILEPSPWAVLKGNTSIYNIQSPVQKEIDWQKPTLFFRCPVPLAWVKSLTTGGK